MRNASAAAHVSAPRRERPHLVLVPSPPAAPVPPASARFAALLAGLITGFVMSALAALFGGGDPTTALSIAAALGVPLTALLVRARVVTVRRRRRRALRTARIAQDQPPTVITSPAVELSVRPMTPVTAHAA